MKRYSTTLKNDQIDSLAIGGFDGIHIAHQKLISHLTPSGALMIIDKKNASLTPATNRCNYLKQKCIFLDFQKIKDLTAEEFVEFLKSNFKNLKRIVVGYDFRFGRDAHGKADDLKRFFSGEVVIVDEVFVNGTSVHSKVIRKLLKDGDIKEANRLLGRRYEISGDVIKGQGIGSKELVSTINLSVDRYLIPKEGVYATMTKIGDKYFNSVSFIGKRLSIDSSFSIETHILDQFIENRVDEVYIAFVDFIRENRRFENLKFLKEQIKKDIMQAKAILH